MTIVRNRIPRIHLHPILFFFFFASLLTGMFMEMAVVFSIVLIHELGHFLMALRFKWRIRKVMLWIFGGVMETDEHGNRPISEEALVVLAGPFQHVLLFILLMQWGHLFLPASVIEIALHFNAVIFFFNLLPIWPLDGGKLVSLILSSFLPYRKSVAIALLMSICAALCFLAVQLFQLPFTLTACCLLIFLLLENWTEWKHRFYLFLRFLLMRTQAPLYKRSEIQAQPHHTLIAILSAFRRNRRHIIAVRQGGMVKRVSEKECLDMYFSSGKLNMTLAELLQRNHKAD